MITDAEIFLAKAEESLEGSINEFKNQRFSNCANRCYYACFQGAIAILITYGFRPKGQWSHTFVQSTFIGELINRRKLFPKEIRDTLIQNQELRNIADYRPVKIVEKKAKRILKNTKFFIEFIKEYMRRE